MQVMDPPAVGERIWICLVGQSCGTLQADIPCLEENQSRESLDSKLSISPPRNRSLLGTMLLFGAGEATIACELQNRNLPESSQSRSRSIPSRPTSRSAGRPF